MNIVIYCISISIFSHLRKKNETTCIHIYEIRICNEIAYAGWGLPVSNYSLSYYTIPYP
jgi:hypothetical protein